MYLAQLNSPPPSLSLYRMTGDVTELSVSDFNLSNSLQGDFNSRLNDLRII